MRASTPLHPPGTRRWPLVPLVASLLVGAACGAVSAQATHPCAELSDAPRRLACYDRAFPPSPALPTASTPSTAAAASDSPDARAPSTSPAENFGLPKKAEPTLDEQLLRITAVVTRIDQNSRGERSFQLNNGQRWAQAESGRLVAVAEGAAVTIERAAFGGFRLVTPAGAGLRVRRLPD